MNLDPVALASLFVASVALASSLYAIRRDRAVLTFYQDTAAGTAYLVVVNVGLRPVRLVGLRARQSRWAIWDRGVKYRDLGGNAEDFPLIIEPAHEATFPVTNQLINDRRASVYLLEDAAGNRYVAKYREQRDLGG